MQRQITLCIVGLGLMGGSLALALRQRNGDQAASVSLRIIGVGRDPATLAVAVASGAIDESTHDLAAAVANADVVILATPVRTILQLLPQVGRHAHAGAVVLDLGSSKGEICAAMETLPEGIHPLGGHPLCGKERAGFAAADPSLYANRPFVLCPLARTPPPALETAEQLVAAIGARPVIVTPAEHDCAVAAISHLPYAVAVSLVGAVAAHGDALAWSLAASGFRDTSRVAASDVDMMLDTLLTNRQPVVDWLTHFGEQLAMLRGALAASDEASLRALLTAAQERRAALAV